MTRYVAVVWNAASSAESRAAGHVRRRLIDSDPVWHASLDAPGLAVFTRTDSAPGDAMLLSQNAGIALGTLFASSTGAENPHRVTTIGDADTIAIRHSLGRSLVSSHWGSYVLFLRSGPSSTHVFRGPVGRLPCHYARYQNVLVFFSEMEDCIGLDLLNLTINWSCVRAQAVRGDYLTRETAIAEIETLISGECIQVSEGRLSRTLYWNPASVQTHTTATDLAQAAERLRSATQMCVNAWMSLHRSVLIQLSGGLDSSILLGCIRRAPAGPQVTAVNFWSHGSGDERACARSMADLTATELLVFRRNYETDLREFRSCRRTVNPVLHFYAHDSEPRLLEIASERNATAIVSGEMGDDVFGHAPGPEMVAQCWRTLGLGQRFVKAALDYGELRRISVWDALAQSIRYSRWQRRSRYWSYYRYREFCRNGAEGNLVSDDAVRDYERELPRFIHPWLSDVNAIPFDRTMILYGLIMATSSWSHSAFGRSDSGMFMMPIASQPLIEAFYEIPCQFHFADGVNGAVARMAFRDYLSRPVLERGTDKGTPDMWNQEVVNRNRVFLREMLLDGVLVREKILDRRKLEAALQDSVSTADVRITEIITQLYIESWARRWTSTAVRAAA